MASTKFKLTHTSNTKKPFSSHFRESSDFHEQSSLSIEKSSFIYGNSPHFLLFTDFVLIFAEYTLELHLYRF